MKGLNFTNFKPRYFLIEKSKQQIFHLQKVMNPTRVKKFPNHHTLLKILVSSHAMGIPLTHLHCVSSDQKTFLLQWLPNILIPINTRIAMWFGNSDNWDFWKQGWFFRSSENRKHLKLRYLSDQQNWTVDIKHVSNLETAVDGRIEYWVAFFKLTFPGNRSLLSHSHKLFKISCS